MSNRCAEITFKNVEIYRMVVRVPADWTDTDIEQEIDVGDYMQGLIPQSNEIFYHSVEHADDDASPDLDVTNVERTTHNSQATSVENIWRY